MTDYDVENSILWDFENYKFPIPLNYDKILRRLFGEYMKLPPKDMQKPHHRIIRVKLGGENHEKI
jgi:lipopolysaccharide cholinephosphotransferase